MITHPENDSNQQESHDNDSAKPRFKQRAIHFLRQNKKTLLATLPIFALMIGLGSAVILSQQSQDIRPRASIGGQSGTMLWLVPDSASVNPDQEIKLSISIDTNSLEITTADLKITFPEAGFQAVRLEPAPAMSSDILLPARITANSASITLGSGLSNSVIGQKVIAYLYLKATSNLGTYEVKIDPATQLTAINYSSNVADIFQGTTLTVGEPDSSPSPTPSPTPTEDIDNQSPRITTRSLSKGRVNRSYSQTITATDKDTNDSLNMTTTQLPSGLTLTNCTSSVNSNNEAMLNCQITGTPTTSGRYPIAVTVTDDKGGSHTKDYTLDIRK